MNIYEKLLHISEMCDVLVKNAAAYNYKYVREEDVLAKVKAGFKKYGIMSYPQIIPNTTKITPFSYEKYDAKLKANKPIQEFLVEAQMIYTFVNIEEPNEQLAVPFHMTASMDDPSLAFGSGLSYSNRYFLLKFFQIPTTQDDPEIYRSKQASAENFAEIEAAKKSAEEVKARINDIIQIGKDLIKAGIAKDNMLTVISEINSGNSNPSSIKTMEVANQVYEALSSMLKETTEKPAKPVATTTTTKSTKKQ